jgi:hypothetical protein
MKQAGGKILNRGSLGSVISPPVMCEEDVTGFDNGDVAKIITNQIFGAEHYKREVRNNEIIAEIDPTNKFTLSPHPKGCNYIPENQIEETRIDISNSGIPLNEENIIFCQDHYNIL